MESIKMEQQKNLIKQTNTQKHLAILSDEEKGQRQASVLKEFVIRRAESSGQTFDSVRGILKSEFIEEQLTYYGVEPKDYRLVYNTATDLYNHDKGKAPFGEDYIISAIKKLQVKQTRTEKPREKREYQCQFCKDTKVEMKGLIPVVIEVEGKKEKMPCQKCL